MNKNINIALVGLGQVGIFLYNELNSKKKEIEIKTGKKMPIGDILKNYVVTNLKSVILTLVSSEHISPVF